MTNRRLESNIVTANGLRPEILPPLTYGSMTIRMAIMALITGGAAAPPATHGDAEASWEAESRERRRRA
jgi:hypothetical protein